MGIVILPSTLSVTAGLSGSVYRDICSKLSDLPDLRDFGAACDGVTADDAALERLIAWAGLDPSADRAVTLTGRMLLTGSHVVPTNLAVLMLGGTVDGSLSFDGIRLAVRAGDGHSLRLVGPSGSAAVQTDADATTFALSHSGSMGFSVDLDGTGGGVSLQMNQLADVPATPIQASTDNAGIVFDKIGVNSGGSFGNLQDQLINSITWTSASFPSSSIPPGGTVSITAPVEGHENGPATACVPAYKDVPAGGIVTALCLTGTGVTIRVTNATTGTLGVPAQQIYVLTLSRASMP